MQTRLNRRLYTKTGINEAVKAFQHLAKIEVGSEDDYHVVTFANVDEEFQDAIIDEFNNYSLHATIASKKK